MRKTKINKIVSLVLAFMMSVAFIQVPAAALETDAQPGQTAQEIPDPYAGYTEKVIASYDVDEAALESMMQKSAEMGAATEAEEETASTDEVTLSKSSQGTYGTVPAASAAGHGFTAQAASGSNAVKTVAQGKAYITLAMPGELGGYSMFADASHTMVNELTDPYLNGGSWPPGMPALFDDPSKYTYAVPAGAGFNHNGPTIKAGEFATIEVDPGTYDFFFLDQVPDNTTGRFAPGSYPPDKGWQNDIAVKAGDHVIFHPQYFAKPNDPLNYIELIMEVQTAPAAVTALTDVELALPAPAAKELVTARLYDPRFNTSISWNPATVLRYDYNTDYSATVTLTASPFHEFDLNAALSVPGSDSVTVISNDGQKIVAKAEFPAIPPLPDYGDQKAYVVAADLSYRHEAMLLALDSSVTTSKLIDRSYLEMDNSLLPDIRTRYDVILPDQSDAVAGGVLGFIDYHEVIEVNAGAYDWAWISAPGSVFLSDYGTEHFKPGKVYIFEFFPDDGGFVEVREIESLIDVEAADVVVGIPVGNKIPQPTLFGEGFTGSAVWRDKETGAEVGTSYSRVKRFEYGKGYTAHVELRPNYEYEFTIDDISDLTLPETAVISNFKANDRRVTFDLDFPATHELTAPFTAIARTNVDWYKSALSNQQMPASGVLAFDKTLTAFDKLDSGAGGEIVSAYWSNDNWVRENAFNDITNPQLFNGSHGTMINENIPSGTYDVTWYIRDWDAIEYFLPMGYLGEQEFKAGGIYLFEFNDKNNSWQTPDYEFVIKELVPNIDAVAVSPDNLPKYGGEVSVTVDGASNYSREIEVYKDGALIGDAWAKGIVTAGTALSQSAVITFPENNTSADQVYTVKVKGDSNSDNARTVTVTTAEAAIVKFTAAMSSTDTFQLVLDKDATAVVPGDDWGNYINRYDAYEYFAPANAESGGGIRTGESTTAYVPAGKYDVLFGRRASNWWYDVKTMDDVVFENGHEYEIIITSPSTFRRLVDGVEKFRVDVAAQTGGKVLSGQGDYNQYDVAVLEAEAAEGYAFNGWYDQNNWQTISMENPYEAYVDSNMKLQARFAELFDVTYTIQPEGAGTVVGDRIVETGGSATFEAIPNPGYFFDQWFVVWYNTPVNPYTYNNVSQDINIIAMFKEGYTVSATVYPEGAGVVTGAGGFIDGGTAALSAAANPGYEFEGWYDGGTRVSSDPAYSFTVEGSRELEARFTLVDFSISTNSEPSGAGTTDSDKDTATVGEVIEVSVEMIDDPAFEGYVFAGWTSQPAVEFENSYAFDTSFVMPASDVTVTANFKKYNSTVDSVSISPNQAEVAVGDKLEFTVDVSGDGEYNDEVNWRVRGKTSAGTFVENNVLSVGKDETAESLDITVTSIQNPSVFDTAVITVISEVTVTFDGNGGTVTEESITTDVRTSLGELPTAEREGFDFIGWNTAKDGSGAAFDAITVVNTDMTVYAQWLEIQGIRYKVTFNGNGGLPGVGFLMTGEGRSLGEQLPSASRSGYTFQSWNTSEDGSGETFTGKTAVTSDIMVYALWSKVKYNEPSGGSGSSGGGRASSSGSNPAETASEQIAVNGGSQKVSYTKNANGNAALNLSSAAVGEIIGGGGTASFSFADSANVKSVTVPKEAFGALGAAGLSVQTDMQGGAVVFSKETVSNIAELAIGRSLTISVDRADSSDLSPVQVSAAAGRTVYTLDISDGIRPISYFNGAVKISLNYKLSEGESADTLVVYRIGNNGEVKAMETLAYDAANGTLTFETKSAGAYVIGHGTPNPQGSDAAAQNAVIAE